MTIQTSDIRTNRDEEGSHDKPYRSSQSYLRSHLILAHLSSREVADGNPRVNSDKSVARVATRRLQVACSIVVGIECRDMRLTCLCFSFSKVTYLSLIVLLNTLMALGMIAWRRALLMFRRSVARDHCVSGGGACGWICAALHSHRALVGHCCHRYLLKQRHLDV